METRGEGRTGGDVAMGTDRVCMACVRMHGNECACVTLLDQSLGRARRLLKLAVFLRTLSLYRLRQERGSDGAE